ncbi:MAG: DUF4249 domain-containing protein [Bacteroidales bacterium]|jgi:hypothetical protein|nr:DUF4249 domain-containing protein [Bacteroidales bacterium]
MKLKTLLYLSTLVILFAACKPEVDLTSNYKNITVVYGVLNPDDSIQYIKVYKGFLVDGDARIAAQNPDSISFYKKITVLLEEHGANNQLIKTIELDTTTSVPISPGDFVNPARVLYWTAEPIHPQSRYKLRILHKESGKEISAETPIVSGINIRKPASYISLNVPQSSTFELRDIEHVAGYSVKLTFYYIEQNNRTREVKHGKIEKNYTPYLLRGNSFSYVPKEFYGIIAANLSPDPNVTRYIDGDTCFKFEVWGGTEELIRYIEINHPSSSVTQNQRIYTNLTSEDNSAYGIFAARNNFSKRFPLLFGSQSEDTLVKGATTGHLNFDYYYHFQGNNR